MNEANKLLTTLLNIRALRSVSKDISIEDLELALEKLTIVVTERQEKAQQELVENAERLAKLEEYRQMMEQDGIDLNELIGSTTPKTRAKRTPRPPKYRFLDDNGHEKTWTGQGRMPSTLQKAVDTGRSLDEFEIK